MSKTLNVLLCLFLFLGVIACNDTSEKVKVIPVVTLPHPEKFDPYKVTINQLIFSEFARCAFLDSGKVEMIWYTRRCIVMDEVLEEETPVKQQEDSSKTIHLHLTDLDDIIRVIDSLPKLEERPKEIRTVRACTWSNLIFVCNNDTLVDYSWDPGQGQINVNKTWWFKYDFDKMFRILNQFEEKQHERLPN